MFYRNKLFEWTTTSPYPGNLGIPKALPQTSLLVAPVILVLEFGSSKKWADAELLWISICERAPLSEDLKTDSSVEGQYH